MNFSVFCTKTRIFFLGLLVTLLALHGVNGAHADVAADPELFSVGSDIYKLSDFRTFIIERPSLQGLLHSPKGVRRAFEEMIDSKIFKLEGLAQGIPADDGGPNKDSYYFAVQDRLLQRCRAPADDELKAFFDLDQTRFATPVLVRLARVAVPADMKIAGRSVSELFDERKAQILAGRSGFDELVDEVVAAMIAKGQTPGVMGDLGFAPIARSEESSLDKQLLDAAKGSIIGPFEDQGLIFLVQVTDRRESVAASWPQIKLEVERVYLIDCRSRNLRDKRMELMLKYDVEINEDVLIQIKPLTASPF